MSGGLGFSAVRVAKALSRTEALEHLDLEVAAGNLGALLVPGGAGRATAACIFTTMLRPDSGAATVCGHDVG